jgi:hypothetical protein
MIGEVVVPDPASFTECADALRGEILGPADTLGERR